MKRRDKQSGGRRLAVLLCLATGWGVLARTETVQAGERKFLVILATSPKQYNGGLPPSGLPNPQTIKNQYFDKNNPGIQSLAEYWEEISYGDVTISGTTTDWISLPWSIRPQTSPGQFIDLNGDGQYEYGQGERFNNAQAAVIVDVDGDPEGADNGPRKVEDNPSYATGARISTIRGVAVWSPGERFLDMDGDGRWDGLDEAANQMDWNGDGRPDNLGPWVDLNDNAVGDNQANCIFLPDSDNDGNPDCCPNGPSGSGCRPFPNPGACPATTWGGRNNVTITDCNGNLVPDACDVSCSSAACIATGWGGICGQSMDRLPLQSSGGTCADSPDGIPDECQFANPVQGCVRGNISCTEGNIDPCCLPTNQGQNVCANPDGGVRVTVPRCEYDDANNDGQMDIVEPFENGIAIARPAVPEVEDDPSFSCGNRMDDSMISSNFPGSSSAKIVGYGKARLIGGPHDPNNKAPLDCVCANGDPCSAIATPGGGTIPKACPAGEHAEYNPPDSWVDSPTTNKMRVVVPTTVITSTPEPDWYEAAWRDRYNGADPPDWEPATYSATRASTFDASQRRMFIADRGGTNGDGTGWVGCGNIDRFVEFGTGDCGNFETACDQRILPEESNGIGGRLRTFDGWVEHDDLPSSKYHYAGDQNLGEVTSPYNSSISGQDRGNNTPNSGQGPDGILPAAGPYAINLHGNLGRDAGNQLQIEALTWRQVPPFNNGVAWDRMYGAHPYAGPSGANLGFRDFNLDGLIDQGETTPPGSENYLADYTEGRPVQHLPRGTATAYPWNRQRLLEDCIQILDEVTNFNNYVDTATLDRVAGGPFDFSFFGPNGGGHTTTTKGFLSGIVLLPNDAHVRFDFLGAASFYPIHNEDGLRNPDSSDSIFPPAPNEQYSWNLWFHDLVISLNGTAEGNQLTGGFQTAYSAHEYLHTWENFPDLYDYDIYDPPPIPIIENCPVGRWDIMADGGLVHPSGPLKERSGTRWIEPVDLASVLTPGVDKTITLPPAEFIRDSSYYYFENETRVGEKFYFWSAGQGFDTNMPGDGMLVMHTDLGSNPEAQPAQQRIGDRFLYHIVQADGLSQMDVCDNRGDAGDIWPGSTDNREFDCSTLPASEWWAEGQCTGLNIKDIEPDGAGSVRVTFNWTPTTIPSLRFINPPGGVSVANIYKVRSEATDLFGGTRIRYFYTQVDKRSPSQSDGTAFALVQKTIPGTLEQSVNWNITGLANGRYFIFADLIPGAGADGTEASVTRPHAGRNNQGSASLARADIIVDVSIVAGSSVVHTGKARSESWVVQCVDSTNGKWVVSSTLTQPLAAGGASLTTCTTSPELCATTGTQYTSVDGAVKFTIKSGTGPAGKGVAGDTFTFATTGLTASSGAVTITNGRITEDPIAAISATPLSGLPPLTVTFDARGSRDPNGQSLTYTWDFGDGTDPQSGPVVQHNYTQARTFTAVLRATNPTNGRFGEASVDIEVINNAPKAIIKANPSSGSAPLTVSFSASESSDVETPTSQLIYQWVFGDGMTGNDQGTPGILRETSHLYSKRADGTTCTNANPCQFMPTLTVTDAGGKSSTASLLINVGNTNPVANITFSAAQGNTPLTVTFNAKSSTDADNDTLTVEWTWGDGSAVETYPAKTGKPPTTDGSVPHTYSLTAGQTSATFKPTAKVKDGRGGEAVWPGTTITVTAAGQTDSNPRALFTISPEQPKLNEVFTADGSLSFDRPTGGLIQSYDWDWGDGSAHSTGVTADHTYTRAGNYVITLTVADGETPPNKASTKKSVAISTGGGPSGGPNRSPLATLVVNPLEGFVGDVFTYDARGSTDPDGDDLTYRFLFGDGEQTAFGASATATHRYEQTGSFLVRLTVRDDQNASTDLTRSIRVLSPGDNRTPIALIATGPRTGAAPLTLTFDGRISYDPDEDPVTYTWTISLNGDVVDTLTGSVVTRLFDETGRYTVLLAVADPEGAVGFSEPETVVVTEPGTPVEPPPPQPRPTPEPPPSSHEQRPTQVCGVGMIMSLFGSLLGLSAIRLVRRRQTWE